MPRIGFVGPAYSLAQYDVACQRCVNWFLVSIEENNEPTKAAIMGVPGLDPWVTLTATKPVRGIINIGSSVLAIAGEDVYTVTSAGVKTSRGTILTTQGAVSLATNGLQVLIVDGVHGYIYTIATGSLSTIVTADYLGGTVCTFLDGYFIVNQPNTQYYQISSLYDGSTWNALDFGAAEGQPDNIVSLIAVNGQLWLFGETTSEVHYNSGDAAFPFARVPGAVMQRGCGAVYSPAVGIGSVYWLGDDRCVYRSSGYQAQKISTLAIDQDLQRYASVSDGVGMVYQQEGHEFYVLTFPAEGVTWVFDGMTGRWHERGEWNPDIDDFDEWIGYCVEKFGDYILVGDKDNGKIYRLDPNCVTNNGNTIIRLRTTPHAQNTMLRMFHSSLTIVMETGYNQEALPTDEPQAVLSWSNDGGFSWGNELWRSMGAQGDYVKRIQWNRLGMSRNRVYKLKIDGKLRPIVYDDSLDVATGYS